MTSVWNLSTRAVPSEDLLRLVDGNTVVAGILVQRGLNTVEKAIPFLDPEVYVPAAPESLYGLEHASNILVAEITSGHNILVWGDFDVDGQTSTALLVSALRRLAGKERVRYHVPNRFTEGHGIRLNKLQELLSDTDFRPHCVLTCDTGITDGSAIGYAKDQGITVIVTDHHDPAPDLVSSARDGHRIWGESKVAVGQDSVRRADAIVDPKFLPPDDALRTLPGVGVAYKLVEKVFDLLGHGGEEQEFLDLVALGIVADVAEQVRDTRYLLQLGLRQLRQTGRIGLLALMDISGLEPESVNTESIGFQLAPRMNAIGRIEDASAAVELLTTDDPIRADQLAAKMERLNQQRRLLTSQISSAALTMIEHRPEYADRNAIVLGHASWHPGIVGIVASKLVEEFHKPAVLLVIPDDGPARGSARSIPSVDIGASIAACSPLLLQYGGHPGAAGVTLPAKNIDRFREALHRQVAEHTIADAPQGLTIDAELSFDQITMDLAEQLGQLAPFGLGNPQPVFSSATVRVTSDQRIGKQATHRRLKVTNRSDVTREVIWFYGGDTVLPPEPFDIAYTLGINEFRGKRTVQLGYVDSRPSASLAFEASDSTPQVYTVQDLRKQEIDPARLPQSPDAAWYAEGIQLATADNIPPYSPRYDLADTNASTLVVWSTPPTPELLQWMQDTVQPSEIVLCGQDTTDDTIQHVLRQVAGMCKYALEGDGIITISKMSARLGTTEVVVRRSLLLLESQGLILLEQWDDGDRLSLQPGARVPRQDDGSLLRAELEEELAEIRAYRRFFLRSELKALGLQESATASE